MSISATVDGNTYNDITTITTGGKTISLSESGGSGDVKIASGEFVLSGVTIYNAPFTISVPELIGCTSFSIFLQVVETGVLATPADPTSEVTMYEHPQSDDNTRQIFAFGQIATGAFRPYDNEIEYPLSTQNMNSNISTMSVSLMQNKGRSCTASIDASGNLSITVPSEIMGYATLYMKYKYKIYGV